MNPNDDLELLLSQYKDSQLEKSPPGRGSDCLKFSELSDLAKGLTRPTGEQTMHLSTCLSCRMFVIVRVCSGPVCDHPLIGEEAWKTAYASASRWADFIKAIRDAIPEEEERVEAARRRWPNISRWLFPSAIAAAFVLLVGSWFFVNRPLTISIRYVPSSIRGEGVRRIDRFHALAEESCRLLGVFWAWDAEAAALVWHVYAWDDGTQVAEARAGERITLKFDVTGDPPFEQVLVVAASRRPNKLPKSGQEFKDFRACLQRAMEASTSTDAADCVSVVRSCLSDGVTVVSRTFAVE